jgi:hypothetical protein
MKKSVPFEWMEHCRHSLDTLIKLVTQLLILAYPDFNHQFEIEVDVSAFAVGAILFQRNEDGKKHNVAYYSHALNPAEHNYNIWDREFPAIVKALKKWHPLLLGTNHKVIIWTSLANLQYYCQPHKVNRRVARGIAYMGDFPLELWHITGKKNWADPPSWYPDFDDGTGDNEEVTALPDELFAWTIKAAAIDQMIQEAQGCHASILSKWAEAYEDLECHDDGLWYWGAALMVPPEEALKRATVKLNHDLPVVRHPRA